MLTLLNELSQYRLSFVGLHDAIIFTGDSDFIRRGLNLCINYLGVKNPHSYRQMYNDTWYALVMPQAFKEYNLGDGRVEINVEYDEPRLDSDATILADTFLSNLNKTRELVHKPQVENNDFYEIGGINKALNSSVGRQALN